MKGWMKKWSSSKVSLSVEEFGDIRGSSLKVPHHPLNHNSAPTRLQGISVFTYLLVYYRVEPCLNSPLLPFLPTVPTRLRCLEKQWVNKVSIWISIFGYLGFSHLALPGLYFHVAEIMFRWRHDWTFLRPYRRRGRIVLHKKNVLHPMSHIQIMKLKLKNVRNRNVRFRRFWFIEFIKKWWLILLLIHIHSFQSSHWKL